MAGWLKLYAGVSIKMLKNVYAYRARIIFIELFIAVLLLSLTSLVFAQKDFSAKYKVMRVPVNKIITITLESNPTTGFSWQLVKISDKMVLEFVNKEYIAVKQNLAGSTGIEKWSFKTLKKGHALIQLEYKRPWEKDVPAAKKEEFDVFVN